MGRCVRRVHGGIRDLLALLREHGEAVEYDLIRLGLRLDWLGTEALSWRDLHVIARQAPTDSALARSVEPDLATWGLSEQLLAMVADYLAWMQWAKTEDGAKGRRMPKRIPRPGVEDGLTETRTFGSDPVPIDELEDFLGWARQRIEQVKERLPQPRDPVTGRFVKRQ